LSGSFQRSHILSAGLLFGGQYETAHPGIATFPGRPQ
jgi:hypothetical protein